MGTAGTEVQVCSGVRQGGESTKEPRGERQEVHRGFLSKGRQHLQNSEVAEGAGAPTPWFLARRQWEEVTSAQT